VSYDLKGDRVPTVNCPNCDVQRPVAIGVCPNCLTSTAPSGARLARGLVRTGLAIAAIVVVGYAISRGVHHAGNRVTSTTPSGADTVQTTAALDSASVPASELPSTAARAAAPATVPADISNATAGPPLPTVPSTPAAVRPAALTTNQTVAASAPPPAVAVTDSGAWESAVALTWVRVRSAPSRESETLRMVDSAQHVQLGPRKNGWRAVRVGGDRGWVDPHLFRLVARPRP